MRAAPPKPVESVLQAIGNTPVTRLNRVAVGVGANFYAKLDFMNPGGSVKDRIGAYLIEDAERKGLLKPGGTIIEGTSGNTGIGLAMASAIKGYKCVFVMPDKMSIEKIRNLRAFGAKVVITPTAVMPEDPRSYYQVSRRLARETPNSVYINQYDNLANREAHYQSLGPEILKQFPEVDALVLGIGTGGTICGVGRYFKEQKPAVKIVAVDPVGSIVYDYFKTGKFNVQPKTYKIEGIGEDFIPKNYDLTVVDDMVQVEDKESFLMTRELLTKEGLYCGVSSGSAVVGALKWVRAQGEAMRGKNVLVLLPDSGNRYLSKVYNDDWMREAGFLESRSMGTVADLMHFLKRGSHEAIITARPQDKISSVISQMHDNSISQVPVVDDAGWVKGIANEGTLLAALYEGKAKGSDTVDTLVDSAVEFVTPEDSIEKVTQMVTRGQIPLITDPAKAGQLLGILTKIDVLSFLGSRT
jgi:cystathionine beta-synthase